VATFVLKNGLLPTFFRKLDIFGASGETCRDGSGQKKWVFARFYLKSGQAETVGTQGFAGFLPTFPLFSLISMKKKCKKIYK
jgi:hypothetical protein